MVILYIYSTCCQQGVDFLLNLIIIDSKGIDIILGMDWLRME
jgi:hypothetical protein